MFTKKKIALAVLFSSHSFLAFAAPDAGTLSNQVKQEREALRPLPTNGSSLVLPKSNEEPAQKQAREAQEAKEAAQAAAQGAAAVMIRRVEFIGDFGSSKNLMPSEPELQAVVKPYLDRALTFKEMDAMTQAVTQSFRQKGLPVAKAVLPAQTIKNDTLIVQVLVGRYDQAQVKNASGLSNTLVSDMVTKTLPSGEVITKKELVQTAMLLGEIPGVRSNISLEAGEKPGTSRPVISLEQGQKWGGYVGFNNHGDASTGRDHVEGAVYANNLAGYGDQLVVQVQDAYRDNDLITGTVDYSVLGTAYGTRFGANYSRLNYSHSYQNLDFTGYSDSWNLYATQPLVRTYEARLDGRVEVGQQHLKDNYPRGLSELLNLDKQGKKRVDVGSAALYGSFLWLEGFNEFDLKGTVGKLDYKNDAARFWNGSDLRDTDGVFVKMNYGFSHERQLWRNIDLYAGITGQKANKNLDGSQKLQMGGPNAIRAYDLGDGLVDTGDIVTAEIRTHWEMPRQSYMGNQPVLTIAPFYDFGRGAQYKDNTFKVENNYFNLAGTGISATLNDAGNYSVTTVFAHRTGNVDPVSGKDDKNRVWLSLNKYF